MTTVHPLRSAHDFYPTPPEATRALLSVERFDGPVWEPACGDGAIANVLIRARHQVVSTDLIDRGWGTGGIDFLRETENRAKHIVTNPPYGRGLADTFIRHALALARPVGGSVAMLVTLEGLAHPMRHRLWVSEPPAAIYAMDELSFPAPENRARRILGDLRFCWIVWRPEHQGRPTFWWLQPSRFRRPEDAP